MRLQVRLVTEAMLYNSVTVRLADMTQEAFLSPLLDYFVDGEKKIFITKQDDTDVDARILNVSFSVKRPDVSEETFYSLQFLRERVYLQRGTLASLATVQEVWGYAKA
ncbi:hypothetical protein Anas_05547 [Armadillidium nasatum]|uniref:Uncharacterized protein n=1 Tax=Armadillidium nasatum TaxID=96803 RepID=A0A5N5TGR7_9CRUS|nr:hypothetical protein Anas_05547 [Armadillidium nasatum]